MSTTMDIYLNVNDSVSLQDMLDIDIKSEVDTLVGGHNDLSGFNFTDLPPLEFEDNEIHFVSSNSNHSNSNFTLDFSEDSSTMVNPNAVMPIPFPHHARSPSPQLKRSHLTFSPCSVKISSFKVTAAAAEFKKDLLNKLNSSDDQYNIKPLKTPKPPVVKASTKSNPTVLTFKNSIPNTNPTYSADNVKIFTQNNNRSKIPPHKIIGENRTLYPKPSYSYSCLIAMALKNSCSGCLPVSEIYNFMIRHFPYFQTAPAGWKNSVRHNLSLNKCFDKIEKPPVNGSHRKGCLWAINPAKVTKMDEEVQKWSRKDPNAIRKAMINPENMESLEHGELKFTYEEDTHGDSCGSAESGEDSETEIELYNHNDDHSEIDWNSVNMKDIDIGEETLYHEEHGVLNIEMAFAEKKLYRKERAKSNKRRKLYIIQN